MLCQFVYLYDRTTATAIIGTGSSSEEKDSWLRQKAETGPDQDDGRGAPPPGS